MSSTPFSIKAKTKIDFIQFLLNLLGSFIRWQKPRAKTSDLLPDSGSVSRGLWFTLLYRSAINFRTGLSISIFSYWHSTGNTSDPYSILAPKVSTKLFSFPFSFQWQYLPRGLWFISLRWTVIHRTSQTMLFTNGSRIIRSMYVKVGSISGKSWPKCRPDKRDFI